MNNNQPIYERLVETARSKQVISYIEIAAMGKEDIGEPADLALVAKILFDIDCHENAEGRPLLSAVVVLPEIGYPRREFFLLARELGLNRYEDDRSFYGSELKKVHDYWQTHSSFISSTPFMVVNGHEVRVAAS